MFGHCALSHTVCRFNSRAIFFRLWKVSPIGAFAFSHAGLAEGFRGVRSICTNSLFNWISDEATGGVIPSIVSNAATRPAWDLPNTMAAVNKPSSRRIAKWDLSNYLVYTQ
jgi:hypothetical protein